MIDIIIGWVFKMLDWIKHRDEGKKTEKLTKSKNLIEKNLRFKLHTDVGFDTQNECGLHIQINNIPTTPDYTIYSEEGDACLEKYATLSDIINKRKCLINKHNTKSQEFFQYLFEDIIHTVNEKNLIEYIPNQTESKNLFLRDNIQSGLTKIIRNNYKTHETFRFDCNGDYLGYYGGWILSDNLTDREYLNKKIPDIINRAIETKEFEKLKLYFEAANLKHQDYKKELGILIKNVEHNNIPLRCE